MAAAAILDFRFIRQLIALSAEYMPVFLYQQSGSVQYLCTVLGHTFIVFSRGFIYSLHSSAYLATAVTLSR